MILGARILLQFPTVFYEKAVAVGIITKKGEPKQKRPKNRVFHPDETEMFLVRFFQRQPEEKSVKKKNMIVVTVLATAFAGQIHEVHANNKKEDQISSLSQQMIQNRKDRIEIVNRSIACLNSAKDSKMLDACVHEEIQSIRQLIDGFCQSESEVNKNSPDLKLFCANKVK